MTILWRVHLPNFLTQTPEAAVLVVLLYVMDWKDLTVEDDVRGRRHKGRGEEALGQVLNSVAALDAEGCHGSGEDDGSSGAGNAMSDAETGLDHGVGAVSDDDRRSGGGGGKNSGGDEVAVLFGHDE